MDEAKCTTHANRRHAISAPQPRRWQAFVLAPRLRGGNRRCKRGALSCCPLQAERISLIGGAEFVVRQRCNFPLKPIDPKRYSGRLIGVSRRAIAIFVAFMRSGTRRSPSLERTSAPLQRATVMVSPPAPVRRVPCRCSPRRRL